MVKSFSLPSRAHRLVVSFFTAIGTVSFLNAGSLSVYRCMKGLYTPSGCIRIKNETA